MKALFFLFLLFLQHNAVAQIIEVKTIRQPDGLSITLEEIDEAIVPDEQYKIKVTGVNSAHTFLKIKSVSKEIYIPLPEALKTILPGIAGSMALFQDSVVGDLYVEGRARLIRLNSIKQKAERLHKLTLFKTRNGLADSLYNESVELYKKVTFESVKDRIPSYLSLEKLRANKVSIDSIERSLARLVKADVMYLSALNDVVESSTKNSSTISAGMVKEVARLSLITNEFKKNDYLKHYNYIDKSRSAKDFVESKAFTGSKDLVELNMLLIDTFANDTIANETQTLYTKRGTSIGLSFSTGFFYTELLSDIPYYLSPRDDESVAVLPEPDKRRIRDVSIGALAHVFYKFSSFTRVGPSIGLAISPIDGKSRYLFGGTVLLGKERMFGLTIGKAWAKVKELSAAVNIDENGRYVPKGTAAVPTVEVVKNVWFIGVTYNLVSTRK